MNRGWALVGNTPISLEVCDGFEREDEMKRIVAVKPSSIMVYKWASLFLFFWHTNVSSTNFEQQIQIADQILVAEEKRSNSTSSIIGSYGRKRKRERKKERNKERERERKKDRKIYFVEMKRKIPLSCTRLPGRPWRRRASVLTEMWVKMVGVINCCGKRGEGGRLLGWCGKGGNKVVAQSNFFKKKNRKEESIKKRLKKTPHKYH